ncbi:hypothetical protein WDW37_17530 [Bdellovibrionota bacterium FG-1]
MNIIRVTIGLVLVLHVSFWASAEQPKKGHVICEGESCREVNVPTGSILGGDRSEKISTTTVSPPQVTVVKKKAKHDQVRLSQAAPLTIKNEIETNLPAYFAGIDRHEIQASEKVIFVPKSHDPQLRGLKSGDVVWAVVEQEITASPGLPTPVRAIATTGQFKGAYFVGEAILDRELKRILFNFTKLRLQGGDPVYTLKAAGLAPRGSIGLEGEYVSQTGKFLIAELASAAATGFVDSTINRSQTTVGSYVQEPSLGNSGKAAAVTALSKTTDRMAEQVRQAPEYTHLAGYQEIQIMIQDDPAESGNQ